MKLLNVPPVKPGQKFKFKDGSLEYKVNGIKWSPVWLEWYVGVTVCSNKPWSGYAVGDITFFYIHPSAKLEILND